MIKLGIIDLIFFYILISVVIILIIWVASGYKRTARREPRGNSEHVWKCSVCFHDYIDSKHEDISICPLCGSYNKKETK